MPYVHWKQFLSVELIKKSCCHHGSFDRDQDNSRSSQWIIIKILELCSRPGSCHLQPRLGKLSANLQPVLLPPFFSLSLIVVSANHVDIVHSEGWLDSRQPIVVRGWVWSSWSHTVWAHGLCKSHPLHLSAVAVIIRDELQRVLPLTYHRCLSCVVYE